MLASVEGGAADAMARPKLSIMVPTYNRARYVDEFLVNTRSITADCEIVVLNDGSTDDTDGVIRFHAAIDPRIRYLSVEQNRGISHGVERLTGEIRGEYFTFFSDDDLFLPGACEKKIAILDAHPDVAFVYSLWYRLDGEGNNQGVHWWPGLVNVPYVGGRKEFEDLFIANYIQSQAVLFRTADLERLGGYDQEPGLVAMADWDLLLRYSRDRKTAFLNEPLVAVRVHEQSFTMTKGRATGSFARARLGFWRKWLVEHPSPPIFDDRHWQRMLDAFAVDIQWELGNDPERVQAHLADFEALKRDHVTAATARFRQVATLADARQTVAAMRAAAERKVERRARSTRAPDVSIVIPVFNKLEFTRQCLSSLFERTGQTPSFEVIVVDNASSDGTAEYLASLGKQVRVIRNDVNRGFARACNQGATAAKGRWLLFLNNDTVPTDGWLATLVAGGDGGTNVGAVGARLLYPHDHSIQHAWLAFVNGTPDHVHRGALRDAPEVSAPRAVDMVTGACLMTPRDLFYALGGFDEAYRNGVEDVDYCLRVRTLGKQVLYEPGSVLYHYEGTSEGRFDRVRENLTIFFGRWGTSIGQDGRFAPQAAMPAHTSAATFRQLAAPPGRRGASVEAPAPTATTSRQLTVRWEGAFFNYHSLAVVNRELANALLRTGELAIAPVAAEPPQFDGSEIPALAPLAAASAQSAAHPDVTIRHAWPPRFEQPPGKWVMIQPWEFGRLPTAWLVPMRDAVDEVWAYSRAVKNVYVESGVPSEKVHVVPLGVDPTRFHPGVEPLPLATEKRVRFLFVGGTIWRKGIDVLLEAYRRTFRRSDDVCLVVKDMGGDSFYKGQTAGEAIREIQADPDAPEILYLTDTLTDDEIPRLYAACTCLVNPFRGEGFALPVAEAMACGRSVIVSRGGPCDDFCPEASTYWVPTVRRPIVLGDTVGQAWVLEPDGQAVADRLRQVYAAPEEALRRGRAASELIRQELTWDAAATRALARLKALATGAPGATADSSAALEAFLAARSALQDGDGAAAGEKLREALELDPELGAAHYLLGAVEIESGAPERALPHFERAVRLDPERSDFHNGLGGVLQEMGRLDDARFWYRRALQLQPGNQAAAENLAALEAETTAQAGSAGGSR
jgi:GT2 family glycosyltransferase/Flp pilus assembly protein TadD